jgi:signal transduction histidine kinase
LTELVRDVPLPVDLEVTGVQPPLRVAAAAYFICAEALSNSVKHAAASSVTVIVGTNDSWLRVEIADDGVGGADTELGSGLRGLADRVETLGGMLELESVSGHGTRLAAEIPLDGGAW